MTEKKGRVKKIVREYAEALLMAVFLAFVIRSFAIEPYKIPSKSMVPTLMVGDHIFVNKFTYGFRFPGTTKWIAEFGEPKRGEVIIFIYPEDKRLDFIKRVVGVPGDFIQMKKGELFVNGAKVAQEEIEIKGIDPRDKRRLLIPEAQARGIDPPFQKLPYYRDFRKYQIKLEDLYGHHHLIQRDRFVPGEDDFNLVVPPDNYFVMGDNRDQSADSRVWGFVPRKNLKGRAMFVWLSLDYDRGGIRYKRFGKRVI